MQSLQSMPRARPQDDPRWRERLEQAIARAREALLELQREDGHWCAELEGDSILESEYILAMQFIGRGDSDKVRKAANYIRQHQMPTGGWAHFPGGDADVSTTVKAYFALKLAGDDPTEDHMVRARDVARELGGLRACNSYTKLYLAIFGQYDWDRCPVVPPEMILLPDWLPFNIYAMSAWSRAIVVPLSMIWAQRPHCSVPEHADISELDVAGSRRHRAPASTAREQVWATFFEAVDILLRKVEALKLNPFRDLALERCEEWVLERLQKSDGLGAIFPPIVNAILALRCSGRSLDDPAVRSQIEELERLEIEEGDTLRLQPCKSPVWDTSQALYALLESGLEANDPAVIKAAEWLLDHEVEVAGDWQVRNPAVPIGGWYFEYANEFYPDCDDTAEVMAALSRVEYPTPESAERSEQALGRAVDWLLGMQNTDGGWASFDRGCDMEVLAYIPFADHNAMIDPSTVDITSRAIEALMACGVDSDHLSVRRAIAFLLAEQEKDGSWFGRWGANYIYGTWLVLTGLEASGFDMRHEACVRAVDWLLSCQNEDGGWGESLRSYDDPAWSGLGESTAAQTAWAVLGLCAAGEADCEAASRGIEFLTATQLDDGTWYDEQWTATGFPRVFYLRYHYYATYFPLLAMAACRRALEPPADGEMVA